ncbi:autoinducer 2 ABC transporter substrate-binding protein [Modestobacter sp. VKM Ac-2985]|uniref:autoinducer 2 ABC transporter substrate-binding protein n=1 Tax=Modestobacter sp. VKM Ac-2985 TaxID=3004139 RepID=UPI0022ABAA18|nr:autoinducer 2 ABC transporter substrate-binding protein [Modestobacter sp. VKM Ac-2985]MCZ2837927.1 autoinducer 2 ABC transporter substrate-binding protein [Modestobacter sp. VKM Ac-2985]
MSARRNRATVAVVGVGMALTLAGCGEGSGGSAGGSGGGSGGGDDMPTIAFVPKLQGIPYFEAMNAGGEAACEELGCEWLYQGPVEADAAAQADIVRSFIQQDVDVLFVAPNDPDSMAPLLQEAADAGIAVGTTDTDAPNSVREVFVSQASTEGIGQTLTDQIMEAMGGQGRYAIVSCGETAENLNSWIEVQREYTASEYPDAEITEVVYAGEDQAAATQMATDLMNSDPTLTGLVGECTSSAPGVAQAVRDAGRIGQVSTVGLGTPNSIAPYLEDGSASSSVLWDVEALGYLTVWAGMQLAEGTEFEATNDVNPDLSAVEYDEATQTLLLGPPLVLTTENVGDFDY